MTKVDSHFARHRVEYYTDRSRRCGSYVLGHRRIVYGPENMDNDFLSRVICPEAPETVHIVGHKLEPYIRGQDDKRPEGQGD
jgi:hypothetical protein